MILSRRVTVLSKRILQIIPQNVKTVLDVGCGNGEISAIIAKEKKLTVSGLEVLRRSKCVIKYKIFNGEKIPQKDSLVDLILLVDVLHHLSDITGLLNESKRVSKHYIVIKDHIYSSAFSYLILKFMDWIGNRSYGVNLIYNYQKKSAWLKMFKKADLKVVRWDEDLNLYPNLFNLLFGKNLHFIALLEKP